MTTIMSRDDAKVLAEPYERNGLSLGQFLADHDIALKPAHLYVCPQEQDSENSACCAAYSDLDGYGCGERIESDLAVLREITPAAHWEALCAGGARQAHRAEVAA